MKTFLLTLIVCFLWFDSSFSQNNKCLSKIHLIRFEISPGDNSISINWATDEEHETFRYYVERSEDGVNFRRIRMVEGTGSSQHYKEYSAVDKFPAIGTAYYRLKQVDYGLNETVAATGETEFPKNIFDKNEVNIYPNPSQGGTFLSIDHLINKEQVYVSVLSIDGKFQFEKSFNIYPSQVLEITKLKDLKPGLYMMRIEVASNVIYKKLIIK